MRKRDPLLAQQGEEKLECVTLRIILSPPPPEAGGGESTCTDTHYSSEEEALDAGDRFFDVRDHFHVMHPLIPGASDER